MWKSSIIWVGLVAAVLMPGGALAWAQAPSEPAEEDPANAVEAQDHDQAQDPPTREQLLDQLGSESHEIREAATVALLADDTLNEQAIRELLEQAQSPEQRHRLLRIAEHHIIRIAWQAQFQGEQSLGSIGFSYDVLAASDNPHHRRPALQILNTLVGFPGYVYLRPGDLVLALNGAVPPSGNLVVTQDWVRAIIGSRGSDGRIAMTLLRDGEVLELDVPCGRLDALQGVYQVSQRGVSLRTPEYEILWPAARRRLLAGLPEPPRLIPAPQPAQDDPAQDPPAQSEP